MLVQLCQEQVSLRSLHTSLFFLKINILLLTNDLLFGLNKILKFDVCCCFFSAIPGALLLYDGSSIMYAHITESSLQLTTIFLQMLELNSTGIVIEGK